MPFSRPTLQTLIDRAVADIETRLPGTDARLRRSNLNVLARVHAGATHGLYGHLDFLSRMFFPDTAEVEFLERWASVWGLARKAAEPASGEVTFTGIDGAVIAAGTALQRSDGSEYATDEEAVVAAGVAAVSVTASEPGSNGNADAGAALTLVTPISGVNSVATIAAGGFSLGTDEESDEDLRARLLERMKQPPHGGAEFDYVAWAKEVPGVTRAWCYPMELGIGTVTVRFMRDDDASAIPDSAEVAAVQSYIDARRPVTAAVTVVAPVAAPLDFTIELTPDTPEVRAAVTAELADLLSREAEPEGTVLLSHIREAISTAAGEQNYVMTVPNADVAHATGQIATLGAITWV